MRVLLSGGGTGGHIYPALAIAESLRTDLALQPVDVLFVGSQDGLEAQIVPNAGVHAVFVMSAPLARTLSLSLVRTVVANAVGFVQSLALLHRYKPDLAIATGGYVTFPVIVALRIVRALRLSRAKIVLLEPNAAPGLTNRLLAPLVDEIWTAALPSGGANGKTVATGTPVRASFARPVERDAARRALGLDPQLTTIVVFGGSQGARSLNDAVAALAPSLPFSWQMLVLAGARDYEALYAKTGGKPRVRVVRYLDDPREAYAAADVVVARAGASTLAELAASGTPALLVPYPHATDDHQTKNAEVAVRSHAARLLPDGELNGERLCAELASILEPATLGRMRAAAGILAAHDPGAAIVARVKTLTRTNGSGP